MIETDASLLTVIARVMQVVTGIAAVSIAVIVYRHNRVRDREAIRERAWAATQQINFIALSNIEAINSSEFTIDGVVEQDISDDDLRRGMYVIFIKLNRINLMWNGYRSGLFSLDEVRRDVWPTLRLISGSQTMLDYCLTRGYPNDFIKFVLDEVAEVTRKHEKPTSSKAFIAELRAQAGQPEQSL